MENIKAEFHLAGITSNFKLNLVLVTMLENCPHYFRDGVKIASCYGAFAPSLWAGGYVHTGTIIPPEQAANIIRALNEHGIPIKFTFTNPLIKTEHLGDNYCNTIMQIANNGMNEVIVASDILENYIRNMYPDYKITSSMCKGITEPEKLHEELEKDYNFVGVDYDFNNKWDILKNLPHKEKCEFLINSSCLSDSLKRSQEYVTIGQHHIDLNHYLNSNRTQQFEPAEALTELLVEQARRKTPFEARKLPHHISPDAIWNEYIPEGFSQFKIEGRGAGKLGVIESYMYYLIKPEYRDEAYFMFMHNLERNGVVKIDNV